MCLLLILSNKLDLNQETRFTIAVTFRFVSIACHAAQGAKVSAVTATGVFANVNELQLVETIDLSEF